MAAVRSLGGPEKYRVVLALALFALWQIWIGIARPGSTVAPAGEVGLCLALVAWWSGASAGQGLALWGICLLMASVISGIPPLWSFLVGWPAWMLVRALAGRQRLATFIVLAVGLISVSRCGAKLLLLAVPHLSSPLTLSGPTLPGSLWAEAAPNLLWLAIFAAFMGVGERARSERPKRTVSPPLGAPPGTPG